jgi:uncharacterized membrane protein YfcA
MSLTLEVLPLLFAAGLSAGFVDAVAGGGGLITLPVLMWAGLPPQLVLGTNKMQACFGTLLAVRRYAKAGLVAWKAVPMSVAASLACTKSVAKLSASPQHQLLGACRASVRGHAPRGSGALLCVCASKGASQRDS